jgi:POT family proton-dependent oligopeptide transporter
VLAPVFASVWLRLGDAVGPTVKLAVGLGLAALSALVMAMAARLAANGGLVSAFWMVVVFALLAAGEVIVGPVVLAAAVTVGPSPSAGRTMSLPWLFSAAGAGVGSLVARLSGVLPPSAYFVAFAVLLAAAACALLAGWYRLDAAVAAVQGRADVGSFDHA